MRCVVVAKSLDSPATRYRIAPIVDRLRGRGDDVTVIYDPGILGQLRMIFLASQSDLILIQRKLLSVSIVKLLARVNTPIVFDHDDAIFLKSSGLHSSTRSSRYKAIIKMSRLVMAGNEYLRQAAALAGANAVTVPTSIDVERYGTFDKAKSLTLVWIGSKSTSRYLEQHRQVLSAIAHRVPSVRLKVIGDFQFNVDGMAVECVDWNESLESQELASAHIGIAPMLDDPWARGKCALKVIQYMAAGLPVVSSDVGANSDVVIDGKTGFLVNSPDSWCYAVEKLVASEELRTSMGAAGRRKVEEDHSEELVATRAIHLLDIARTGKLNTAQGHPSVGS